MRKSFNLPGFVTVLLFAVCLALCLTPVFGSEVASVIGFATVGTYFVPAPLQVLGLNTTNNFSARESFIQAKKMFYRAFRDKFPQGEGGDRDCAAFVESLKLSQSEIRLEVQLDALRNSFVFGLTPNQANSNNVQFVTERRLNLQDSLVVNEYGVFAANPASQADHAYQLQTYGDIVNFTTAQAAALNSTFYSNGYLQVRANNDVVIPYRGLFNHLYRPQTQQTAALAATSPGNQIRGAEDGFITAEPNLILIGSKNYVPEIVLPGALASVAAFERAVIIFRGVLAQNSTVVS